MDLIFIAPSTRHPSGGVAMVYEFAGAMAARGHSVHLYHVPFLEANASSLADLDWFEFAPGIQHHFHPGGQPEPATIPAADFIFGYRPDSPPHAGLPLVLIQGHEMLDGDVEEAAFRAPCPKVCVATWLVDVGRRFGVPEAELAHVPLGLRHDKYRLTRPIDARPPRVSLCYSEHPSKGAEVALEVLRRAKDAVPELEVTLFGARPPSRPLPEWMRFRVDPPQGQLVEEVYNTSRIFLCTSRVEGFGLSNIEAMAGGAALVTTDNGGSDDYAIHGQTALVAPVGDVASLSAHVTALLREHDHRRRIAAAGQRYVSRFSWDGSAVKLEALLARYQADPIALGHRPGAAQRRGTG